MQSFVKTVRGPFLSRPAVKDRLSSGLTKGQQDSLMCNPGATALLLLLLGRAPLGYHDGCSFITVTHINTFGSNRQQSFLNQD